MKKIIFNYLMTKKWFLEFLKQRFDEEMNHVEYNAFAEGCGLENLNIQDRYEAMGYGWHNGFNDVEEAVNNLLKH
jgi:thiamine pyrophosphate-dependent acetolactate synthase large subunit-like protein